MKLSAATGTKRAYRDCGVAYYLTMCMQEKDPTLTVEWKTCLCNTNMCNGEFDLSRIYQRLFCTVSSESTNLYIL